MKVFKKFLGIVLLVVMCCATFWITKKHYQLQTVEVSNESFETIETFSGETLKYSLNNMGFLVTAEYHYTHVETYSKDRTIRNFKMPFTNAKFIYTCDGMVSAGIDFSKIDLEVNDNAKEIKVFIPKVECRFSEIDHNSVRVFDETKNIFNPITVEEVNASFDNIKKLEEENAIKKGLNEQALKNAKVLIENFLKNSCGEEYSITFLGIEQNTN